MSGLTKKQVWVDRNLSMILGVAEGEQVSYSEIQKNLHKYIRNNDLKNPLKRPKPSATQPPAVEKPQPSPPPPQQQVTQPEPIAEELAGGRYCQSCGAHIASDAVFCDMCGADQQI